MNNSTFERITEKTILWGVPLLGAGIALAFSFVSLNPLSIKSALLQSGACILFAVLVVSKAGRRRLLTLNKPLFRMMVPAFLFMVSAFFSFFFITASKDTSLDELLLRLPYFLVFFIGAIAFSNPDRIHRVLGAITVIVFVTSLYGILQHFRIDPLGMGDHIRIQSTFGNPNFYVGFLTLMLPVVAVSFDFADTKERKRALSTGIPILTFTLGYYLLTLFTDSRMLHAVVFGAMLAGVLAICLRLQLKEKTFAAVTLFILANNVFFTGSRSGQIGLGAGLILLAVGLFLYLTPLQSSRRKMYIIAVSVCTAGLVTAGVLHITYSDDGRMNTVLERKYYVDGALNLIGQKPLFGHGIGTFKNNYPLIKKPESWAYNATCFEHVSNVYNEHLEILHDEGIVGVILWVWLLIVIFVSSYRSIRVQSSERALLAPGNSTPSDDSKHRRFFTPSPPVLLIGLGAGTASLLIGNIFSLSMRYASTGYFFWLFMGFIAALAANTPNDAAERGSGEKKKTFPPRRRLVIVLLDVGIVLAATAVSVFAFRIYLADVYLNKAVNYSKEAYVPVNSDGEVFHDIFIEGTRYRSDVVAWEKAIHWYQKSLSYNPYDLRTRYFFGNAFNRRWHRVPVCNQAWGDKKNRPRTDDQRAMEQYEYVIRQAPHYTEIDFELGDLFMKLGNIDKAISVYRDYKRYKPFFTKIHYALANAYVAKKDWAAAAEAYKDALDLNAKFTRGYCELSAVYDKMKKKELARDMFEQARELSPRKVYRIMADVWKSLGENDRATDNLHRSITEDSTDATVYAQLGWRYIQDREWDKAIDMYEKAIHWNPSHAPAWVNLSNLYYEKREMQKAQKAFRRAMMIDSAYVKSVMQQQRP